MYDSGPNVVIRKVRVHRITILYEVIQAGSYQETQNMSSEQPSVVGFFWKSDQAFHIFEVINISFRKLHSSQASFTRTPGNKDKHTSSDRRLYGSFWRTKALRQKAETGAFSHRYSNEDAHKLFNLKSFFQLKPQMLQVLVPPSLQVWMFMEWGFTKWREPRKISNNWNRKASVFKLLFVFKNCCFEGWKIRGTCNWTFFELKQTQGHYKSSNYVCGVLETTRAVYAAGYIFPANFQNPEHTGSSASIDTCSRNSIKKVPSKYFLSQLIRNLPEKWQRT